MERRLYALSWTVLWALGMATSEILGVVGVILHVDTLLMKLGSFII